MSTALLIGLGAGLRHALEADHLVAVSTLVSGESRPGQAARVGIAWGMGHGIVVLSLGLALALLGHVIRQRTAALLEIAAAAALVGLGLRMLWRWGTTHRVHWHRHSHGGHEHAHLHVHGPDIGHAHAHAQQPVTAGKTAGRSLPFILGMMHGLGGTAAITLLWAAAAPGPGRALGILLLFAAGSTAGMAVSSLALALPVGWAGRTFSLQKEIGLLAGTASLAMGLLLGWQIYRVLA